MDGNENKALPKIADILEMLAHDLRDWAAELGKNSFIRGYEEDVPVSWYGELHRNTEVNLRTAISILEFNISREIANGLRERFDKLYADAEAYDKQLEELELEQRKALARIQREYREQFGTDMKPLWKAQYKAQGACTVSLPDEMRELMYEESGLPAEPRSRRRPIDYAYAMNNADQDTRLKKEHAHYSMQKAATDLAEHLDIMLATRGLSKEPVSKGTGQVFAGRDVNAPADEIKAGVDGLSIDAIERDRALLRRLHQCLVRIDAGISTLGTRLRGLRQTDPHGLFSEPTRKGASFHQVKEVQDQIEEWTGPILEAAREAEASCSGISGLIGLFVAEPVRWETDLRESLRHLRDELAALPSSHGADESQIVSLGASLYAQGTRLEDGLATLEAHEASSTRDFSHSHVSHDAEDSLALANIDKLLTDRVFDKDQLADAMDTLRGMLKDVRWLESHAHATGRASDENLLRLHVIGTRFVEIPELDSDRNAIQQARQALTRKMDALSDHQRNCHAVIGDAKQALVNGMERFLASRALARNALDRLGAIGAEVWEFIWDETTSFPVDTIIRTVHVIEKLCNIDVAAVKENDALGKSCELTPEVKLTDTESNILQGLGNETLRGSELLKKAGYDNTSHYRQILSNLKKRGVLGNQGKGYFKA